MNSPSRSPDKNPVARLRKVDACAVSDALDKLGIAACVSGLTSLSSSRRIAGRVHTVKLVEAANAPVRVEPPRHLGCAAVEAAEPGDIIVVEQLTGIDCGSWGGILSLAAHLRGVAGVIAEGPVRDVDEARQIDFPVYARSATARTARGRIAEEATDVPVQIGGVTVHAGDYAIADSSAVVFIRAADISRVLDAAEAIVARETVLGEAVRDGRPVSEVMGANYENMLKN